MTKEGVPVEEETVEEISEPLDIGNYINCDSSKLYQKWAKFIFTKI